MCWAGNSSVDIPTARAMFEYAKTALSGDLASKGPALPFSIGEAVHFDCNIFQQFCNA